MKYQIIQGTVSLGGRVILDHIDFEIRDGEKIAITGRNGSGKTTLLRLIAGELETDRDDKLSGPTIVASRSLTCEFLSQTIRREEQDRRIGALLLEKFRGDEKYSRERFVFETECDRLLTGFGFTLEDKKRPLREFSGGQQTKLRLIRLLLECPDILLLDEPTNHLDLQTVEWLEKYMKTYPGAVVFVSHDRYFLDQVVSICYDLERGKLTRYTGNYSESRQQKLTNIRQAQKAYEAQQEEIRKLEDLIRTFKNKPTKASFARSRKTMLERMVKLEEPTRDEAHLFTGPINPLHPGSKWILDADHLVIGYEKKALLELTLRIRRGQKIGIIGPNGIGKTTFLKTLAGHLEPVKGSFGFGNHTSLGYFDQQSAELVSEKSVVEHFHDLYPGLNERDARQILGNYLFGGRKAQVRVSDLSGGEKARLVLCELLQAGPNLLILDEPTNHMDIPARETLESAFAAYTGTILFVSHDRYFIRQVADAILVFDEAGVTYYPFGYDDYKKKSAQKALLPSSVIAAENMSLMEHFKSVARAERHETRHLTSEEAYVDWRMRLADDELLEAELSMRVAAENWEAQELRTQELWQEQLLKTYAHWLSDAPPEWESGADNKAEEAEETVPSSGKIMTREDYRQAEEKYHAACMKWYEVVLELEL